MLQCEGTDLWLFLLMQLYWHITSLPQCANEKMLQVYKEETMLFCPVAQYKVAKTEHVAPGGQLKQ